MLSDDDLDDARRARTSTRPCSRPTPGFDFVDVKHCHGYLLHELLGAVDRPGRVRRVVRAPHRVPPPRRRRASAARVPGPRDRRAPVGLRLRALRSRRRRRRRAGRPTRPRVARYAFGGDASGIGDRPHRGAPLPRPVPRARHRARVHHRRQPVLQPARPAAGVLPAVRRLHPARGPARRRGADDRGDRRAGARASRRRRRRLGLLVPPAVAAPRRAARRAHGRRGVGGHRPRHAQLPAPAGRRARGPAARRPSLLCRTFSDCTTAPRNGLVSGCYPLDDFYKDLPERIELAAIKKATRKRTRR